MALNICIGVILTIALLSGWDLYVKGWSYLSDKWHNRSIKPPLEFYKTSMQYCKRHDEWYDPVYGDGCWKCLIEAKNEE